MANDATQKTSVKLWFLDTLRMKPNNGEQQLDGYCIRADN